MAVEEIHQYDIGTIFRMTVKSGDDAVDISGATEKYILFKKPDATVVTQDAEFLTDGSDGIIQYTTVEDDLDLTGKWKIQARVILSSGTWSSDIGEFTVYKNVD